jgi:putative CocE/NonD family hydrolase
LTRMRGRALSASLLALSALAMSVPAPTASAKPGPYEGGPTDFFTTSDGDEIALTVVLPKGYEKGKRYPAILEMAGYENGSSNAAGRTMLGQTKDFLCAQSNDPDDCPEQEPPLADDSHHGTSAFRYDDDYVTVHASLPGTGCSSGEFSLYSYRDAKAGAELIDDWMAQQPWSNGRIGLLGHSYSGATAVLIAAHRPEHLVAMTVSGLVDDNYRGITFPGGVLNTLFPPLWYLGIRNAYHVIGGSGQGIVRNIDNENGQRCAENTASHTVDMDNDPILNGLQSQGLDNEYWHRVSMISYIDRINVPIHITGTFNDEQTGNRGTARLWQSVAPGVPKRLLQTNGDHDTNVISPETWGDRKAWMDRWMRGIQPDPSWNMTTAEGEMKPSSVRTLFELHPNADGKLVSNGHYDGTTWPLAETSWKTFSMCAGKKLSPEGGPCEAGSDTYLSGTHRQSWLYQAGPELGPPFTSEDAPDQIRLDGPKVGPGEAWAIDGPIVADLNLSITGNNTDLFVQVADENTETNELSFLTRGWLKASHRAIDADLSDRTDVDPARPNFMYRPFRHHTDPVDVPFNEPVDYKIEVWPIGHVFRPGHRLVVIVTSPPVVDSNYSFAAQSNQPASLNTLNYGSDRSSITFATIPLGSIADLGSAGPGCGDYWQVRCVSERT